MNSRTALLIPAILLLLLASAVPAASEPTDAIIVNGADTLRTDAVSASQELVDLTANVGPRIVAEYANHLRQVGLAQVPGPLQTELGKVSARVVVEFANAVRHSRLVTIPTQLGSLLIPVPDRIILEYANHNRAAALVYPAELFDDSATPQISAVSADSADGIVTWLTDEFADSAVLYGVQTGVYTGTVSDPLYAKQHGVTLPGLVPGTTYYYEVRSADRSGNTATSAEHSFTAQISVYLPLVLRNR